MKKILTAVIATLTMLVFVACSTTSSMSYTFNVSSGDQIKVELDTSQGHSLSQSNGTFSITYNDESESGNETKVLAEGSFLLADADSWQVVYDDINGDPDATIIKEETLDGNDLIYVNFADLLYTCCIKVADSNSGVLLNAENEADLQEAIKLLTFTAE